MGKGGSSKSTNNTQTTSTSGQNGITGDNLGVTVAGVNNSSLDITMTDHGAIEKATEMAELSMTTLGDGVERVLDSNTDVTTHAIDSVERSSSVNAQHLAAVASSAATQNAKSLETVAQLATTQSDGGQIETTQQIVKAVAIVVGGAAAVLTAKAVFK